WYLVFSWPEAAVLGELASEGGRLALPNGRFLVVRHQGGASAVALVDLSWGGRRLLGDRDFRSVAREELVARAGRLELRPWRIESRMGFEASPDGALPLAARIGGVIGWHAGALEIAFEAAYAFGGVETVAFGGDASALVVDPQVAWRAF